MYRSQVALVLIHRLSTNFIKIKRKKKKVSYHSKSQIETVWKVTYGHFFFFYKSNSIFFRRKGNCIWLTELKRKKSVGFDKQCESVTLGLRRGKKEGVFRKNMSSCIWHKIYNLFRQNGMIYWNTPLSNALFSGHLVDFDKQCESSSQKEIPRDSRILYNETDLYSLTACMMNFENLCLLIF